MVTIDLSTITLDFSTILSLIALLTSIAALSLTYRYRKLTTGAAIKHELINLPPYKEIKTTTINITNVGNARTRVDRTYFTFSWDEAMFVELDYESDEFFLYPKEPFTVHQKLPTPDSKGLHTITITTDYDDWEKSDNYPIYVS